MKYLPVVFAYLFALAVTIPLAFFAVLILAGPHGGLLPDWLGGPVLILAWFAVLALPPWVAYRVWRRVLPSTP